MALKGQRPRETPEVAAAAARMIRAVGKRAETDVDSLILLRELRAECDRVIAESAREANRYGWSWAHIGRCLGITRQAAHQAYGVNADLTASTPEREEQPCGV